MVTLPFLSEVLQTHTVFDLAGVKIRRTWLESSLPYPSAVALRPVTQPLTACQCKKKQKNKQQLCNLLAPTPLIANNLIKSGPLQPGDIFTSFNLEFISLTTKSIASLEY